MSSKFSEYISLIIFTSLIIISTGIIIAVSTNHFFSNNLMIVNNELIIALFLGISAMFSSFIHISKKKRSIYALNGISHSWLSKEILLVSFFVFITFLLNLLNLINLENKLVSLILANSAIIVSILLLYSIGMVYNLNSQINWIGSKNKFSLLVSSLLFSFLLLNYISGMQFYIYLGILFLCIDLILFQNRYKTFQKQLILKSNFVFSNYLAVTKNFLKTRFYLSIILVVFFASFNFDLSFYLLSLIIIFDRITFYLGAIQISPNFSIKKENNNRISNALLNK